MKSNPPPHPHSITVLISGSASLRANVGIKKLAIPAVWPQKLSRFYCPVADSTQNNKQQANKQNNKKKREKEK
jgi:hypothetical protein